MLGVILVAVVVILSGALILLGVTRRNKENNFLENDATKQLFNKPVDLQRYLGLWHEAARLPNNFETDCINVTANYSLENGVVKVKNTCGYKDGSTQVAEGEANLNQNAGQYKDRWLKVSFFGYSLPSIFSQFFEGDYLILHVTENSNGNYDEAVVGSIDKNYLWVLSRTPNLTPERLNYLLSVASSKGYDTSKIILK